MGLQAFPLCRLLPVLLLAGCAGAPPLPPHMSPLSAEPDAAVLTTAYRSRNDSYLLLTPTLCVDPAKPGYQASSATGMYGPEVNGVRETRVKPLSLLTISYGYSISDQRCVVDASVFLAPGGRYLVSGNPTFSGKLLPVSTGCQLTVKEAESGLPLPLLPPRVTFKGGVCQMATPVPQQP